MRPDQRHADQLRPTEFVRHFIKNADGSVLIRTGDTHVLCTASIETGVKEWREPSGFGWLTAEYDMLPASTGRRRDRGRGNPNGRATEIQRLIGRCLRVAVDLTALGQNTITIDCDVIQADGGTRTAAITGAYVALCDALRAGAERDLWPVDIPRTPVAAVSVGLVDGEPRLDLNYKEDSAASVDCNLVRSAAGDWIEIQSSGEESTFSDEDLAAMLALGRQGIAELFARQAAALGDDLAP
jgi:ribonuclease PH